MKGDDIAERMVALAARAIKVVDALPKNLTGKHIAAQLLRAATSSGANYEEARGAESSRDFVHKLGVALKELQEARYWLRVVERSELVGGARLAPLLEEIAELCRILGASKAAARKSARAIHA
jgi:four helix bundle protein